MEVKVTLRNPLNREDKIAYYIDVDDTQIGRDWLASLKEILVKNQYLEKNYCFMGWPNSARSLDYLCEELNRAIFQINQFNFKGIWHEAGLKDYGIFEWFHPNVVRFPIDYGIPGQHPGKKYAGGKYNDSYLGLGIKHDVMNTLHNHFERLQGTVEDPSPYYQHADHETKYAIRQLNNLCHEIENLVLSQRHAVISPDWVRPSQITTYFGVKRHELTDEHRQGFVHNGYDRKFGHVYMHWTQIGKTLFEVWRDEHAPTLNVGDDATTITVGTGATCEAITALKYFSGEFDVEWAKDVVRNNNCPWHDKEQVEYENWLLKHGLNPRDPKLSLGYLQLGRVNFEKSFGTTNMAEIWAIMSRYLDIYSIEVDDVKAVYDYCWSDIDYKQQQINRLKPGYDYQNEMAKKLNKQD